MPSPDDMDGGEAQPAPTVHIHLNCADPAAAVEAIHDMEMVRAKWDVLWNSE